jgi:hypothetical protein
MRRWLSEHHCITSNHAKWRSFSPLSNKRKAHPTLTLATRRLALPRHYLASGARHAFRRQPFDRAGHCPHPSLYLVLVHTVGCHAEANHTLDGAASARRRPGDMGAGILCVFCNGSCCLSGVWRPLASSRLTPRYFPELAATAVLALSPQTTQRRGCGLCAAFDCPVWQTLRFDGRNLARHEPPA